jgi:hypothetical protein
MIRNAIALESDGGTRLPVPVIPNWLMLEYTVTFSDVGSINFQVWTSMIGPVIGGTQ